MKDSKWTRLKRRLGKPETSSTAVNKNLQVEREVTASIPSSQDGLQLYEIDICARKGLTSTIVADIAKTFTQDQSLKVSFAQPECLGNGSFKITTSVPLDPEDSVMLDELCHLHLNWAASPQRQIVRDTSSHTGNSSENSQGMVISSNLPDNHTPYVENLRVKNVPESISRDELETLLRALKIFSTRIKVLSTARTGSGKQCGTFALYNGNLSPLHKNTSFTHGVTIDADFHDITPLYEPSNGTAVVDIIAIPGLATNAIWTFRPKSQAEIWLRDLLPKDISNCRVLLYGYDSKVIGSSDTSAAPQVAQSMGNSITRFRQKTNTHHRPIIYLGHSLGGILIKEMLRQSSRARRNDDLLNLWLSCSGLMFFGVPNQGLHNPPLEIMSAGRPNQNFILSFLKQPGAQVPTYLVELDSSFKDIVQAREERQGNLNKVCFAESLTSPTPEQQGDGQWKRGGKETLMVDYYSASLASLDCMALTLPGTTHSNLTKFKPGDPNYDTVLGYLEVWIKQLPVGTQLE